MQFPEFQRSISGGSPEDGDKVAGILKAHLVGDVLDFCFRAVHQQFFCLLDAVVHQISIDGAAKETFEQPGEILGCENVSLTAPSILI